MLNIKKTPENVLQEELLKERAEVLRRAGESLAEAIEKAHVIGRIIEDQLSCLKNDSFHYVKRDRRELIAHINGEIKKFNIAREYANLKYYYLIVTREAMGMRRHHWVDEAYVIPEKKKYLRDV